MSVFTSDMFIGCEPIKCDCCGKITDKWINIIPGGNLCEGCAQMTMRRLFEDLIEYYNPGKQHISLLGIMYHGNHRKEQKPQARTIAKFME